MKAIEIKNVNSRFVVVGKINDGDGEVTKYTSDESKLATAIYRETLEESTKKHNSIEFTNKGIAKAQAENDALIKSIFG